ncbi:hypothetical protein B0T17DRAFT_564881 [Bombardia bombarda]|uniref:Uncharacterized protein n=1 Tax=Bombardia bombarda TaxID=252184 RepID=A0AA39WAS4_9PEZI|nr:hypothetical protein B0T17DRAFT_564881 [Bombardia bombarda]
MSIAIPGTTIDVRDVKEGGTFIYGAEYSAFPPLAVRQAEARLVDNMCPLSYIMVGNTGKSVSRSYSRALDGLVPKHATVKTGGKNPIRSPGEQGYDDAMKYLTTVDDTTGLTPVDIYVEKQTLWAEAQDEWDKAKLKAQKDATLQHPDDTVLQRQTYDEWNQANYRKYKFAVQARWMDWVSNGHKYNVEFNFGMVDTESIMARIENSKESMRNSTIVDADGANEVYLVDLTPKNWATLCKQKQEGWFRRNGQYSLEQLDGEIQRLQRLWGMSVGGGAGWGLWSVGGSYAHDESKTDSQSDMASCDVSVTFDALVVNIGRPWLYAELFSDFELDVADDILLSPGASELQRMMKEQLAQYNSFPAFPTSFVLAANTVIDFKGSTQHIEDHFSSSSSSGSSSVGWGPFSVRSSFHSSSQSQTHQMQATATGCRLTFGAPQIIGWVNQILPALPRTYAFEPMVQSNVPSRS